MAAPQHFLVSFENVSATVGGVDISSIAEIHLSAAANSIPQVTLLVDAGHSEAGGPSVVAPVSLDNARQIFDSCRSMVKTDGATLSLSLTCRLKGPGGEETQSLSINDWLLTDVSLSPIQESGICTAALTFQHPVCKTHLGGAIPGLLAAPPVLTGVYDGNPLAVFINSLQAYSTVHRAAPLPASIPGATDPARVRSVLLQHLEKATSDLSATVSWTHGGLPAVAQLAGWSDLLCQGLSAYALPGAGSVFQTLVSRIIPECSLALGGDYTGGKLELGPFEPWADASLRIKDSDVVSLTFPQHDPTPISGVKIAMSATSSESGISYHPINCQVGSGAQPAEAFYVPESELSAPYMYGPIHQFSEPGWMTQMSYYALNRSDGSNADVSAVQGENLQTAMNTPRGGGIGFSPGSASQSPAIDYASAMLACAKAFFETSYMKDWSFTVNTRLLFSSGGLLCPGRVLGVTSGAGEVLGGYIASVEHSISVGQKTAMTRITCSHPRFGSRPAAISSGSNALYT